MTVHEDAARHLLDDVLLNPEAAAVFAETRVKLRADLANEEYVAWIGQTPRGPSSWTHEQVAAYLAVHAGLGSGRYAKVTIEVGATPGADADREGNAQKLMHVAPPFVAMLDMGQNGADCDGTLHWGQEIKVEKSTGIPLIDHGEKTPVNMIHSVNPASVPLEVGYTKPSRTLMHLTQYVGVARWAYGDERICLLLNVDKAWGRLGRRSVRG